MTAKLNLKPISHVKAMTVINLYTLEGADMIRIDGSYQTDLRWTLYQKQLFIDSLLRGLDIPKLYVDVQIIDNEEICFVVDGQQRLNAIKQFLDNEFPLLSDADPIDGKVIAGKKCEELCRRMLMMHFDNRNLDIVFLRDYTSDMIKDLFLRLNSMSALNAAEKRNAIPGNMPNIVKTLARHKIFSDNNYLAISKKRAGHQNVVAAIFHQLFEGSIVDIRPVSIANTYKNNASISRDHNIIIKIKRCFNFLVKAFKNRSNPKL